MTKKDIHRIIVSFIIDLKNAILADKVVEFRGFGTFEVKARKGREKARNPKTGQTVQVQDHGTVSFHPGKELKVTAWDLRR